MSEDRVKLEHNNKGLRISYKWYDPKSNGGFIVSVLLFSLFLGLLIWVLSLGKAFQLAALLGFSLLPWFYSLLSFYKNDTVIEINDKYVAVKHQPVPTLYSDKKIPTERIKQLFVKERINNSSNQRSAKFDLMLTSKTNMTRILLTMPGISAKQLQSIESYLEEYLGIIDTPVKGEYAKDKAMQYVDTVDDTKNKMPPPSRFPRLVKLAYSPLKPIYDAELEEVLPFMGQEIQVVSINQLDWNDGNSDKVLQLFSSNGNERLIYLSQNKAILKVYEETKMDLAATKNMRFKIASPPTTIDINSQTYSLSEQKKGRSFVTNVDDFTEQEQWLYFNENKTHYIRISNNNEIITYHQGYKMKPSDFEKKKSTEDKLDLDEKPLKLKQLRKDELENEL